MDPLPVELVTRFVEDALAEDIGSGDATTLATIPADSVSRARMVAREHLVVAGLEFADTAFRKLSTKLTIKHRSRDGKKEETGGVLMEIAGPTRALLTAERVALNFVQRLSGIATLTSRYVEAVMKESVQILDTRKTTPGWRRLEKYAVQCGGGANHRFGLDDLILIKDNHLTALRNAAPNPIGAAVIRARDAYPDLRVEVEADTLEQVEQAVEAHADVVLLDNMTPEMLREAVEIIGGRCETEASGGIQLENIRSIAETGVDYISIGALTHSARAVDIGLDFDEIAPSPQ